MILVSALILVACSGTIYSLYLIRAERSYRLVHMMQAMESEAGLVQAIAMDVADQSAWVRWTSPLHRFMPAAVQESYHEKLMWAGRPFGLDRERFISLKLGSTMLFSALVPLVTLFQLGNATLSIMLVTGTLGFFLPDLWLNGRLDERRRQAARELPLVTDLIATALDVGLPLTEAVRRVATDAPGLVSHEFLRAVQEMAAGKPRMESWRDVMDRVPGEELRSIVTAIMQAEQNGTSVSDMLRYQVQQIRTLKQQEAQKVAQSVQVKMRLPMLLLILFPFMVLLLGPALLKLAELIRR